MVMGFPVWACRIAALAIITLIPFSAHAEEAAQPLPPWMAPEVIKAAIDIGLDEAQQPEFRRIVGEFITNRMSMIAQEIRRSPPNLDRVIKTKTRRLEKTMDTGMKAVLTEPQWPAYENYKDVLFSKFQI